MMATPGYQAFQWFEMRLMAVQCHVEKEEGRLATTRDQYNA